MHVGLITSDLSNKNGWATYSLNLIQALHARGIQTTIVTAHNSPDVPFPIHRLLPSVTPPQRHTFVKMMQQVIPVRRLLADCDLIHCTVEPYAPLAHIIAGRRPLFITAHGSYVNLPRMRKFPLSTLYRRAYQASELICVSRHTAQVARDIIPSIRTTVINNGVDASRFLNPPPLPTPKTAPTIISAGGIKPRKGTLPLVEAIAVVREQIPDVQCLIMGNPQMGTAYYARVENAIQHLNLEDHVQLMGFVDDAVMRAWLASADVVALPSVNDGYWFEGFGLVLMEASASGTAVIGTDQCGVADAIDDGETGIIVSQAKLKDDLPRAILALLTDPEKARQMGIAGRQKAEQQTWSHVAEQVIACYDHVLRTT